MADTVTLVEADDLQMSGAAPDDAVAAGERLIADRLDALEAERVMQRALELEAESLDEPHVITTQQLERIAKEIGVDPAFVHQALGEMRLEPRERGRFARWILPDDLFETETLTALSREDLDAAITKWMTQNEGLTPGGKLSDGIEWSVDRRWRARVLSRSLSGGNRISRVASGDVNHRVHSVSEQEHVVAFESEGRLPLLFAQLTMAFGAALAVLALANAAAAGSVVNGIAYFAVIAGLSVGLGVGGARWWGQGIQAALRRSLIGLVDSAQAKRRRWFGRRKGRS